MTARTIVSNISEAASAASSSYRNLFNRRLTWLVAGLAGLAISFVFDILTGPAFLSVSDVVLSLFAPQQSDETVLVIVRSIRLPMTVMAIFVGASLGVAGVIMQTILGNPLASPYTLGFSTSAGFGASIAIFTGFTLPLVPWLTIPFAAFLMAAVAAGLVYSFATLKAMSSEVMILAGIATLFLFQSLQSLVQYLAAPEVLQAIVFWLFGSLLKASWSNVPIVGTVFIICFLAVIPDLWRLTALRLGDMRATALGIDVKRLRIKMFVLITLLTSAAVAIVGTIGFVGLVAPHIARMLVGEDQRLLVPMAAVMGAFVITTASICSKLISPGSVIPIGIVTAIIGVPFLFILILRKQRNNW